MKRTTVLFVAVLIILVAGPLLRRCGSQAAAAQEPDPRPCWSPAFVEGHGAGWQAIRVIVSGGRTENVGYKHWEDFWHQEPEEVTRLPAGRLFFMVPTIEAGWFQLYTYEEGDPMLVCAGWNWWSPFQAFPLAPRGRAGQ